MDCRKPPPPPHRFVRHHVLSARPRGGPPSPAAGTQGGRRAVPPAAAQVSTAREAAHRTPDLSQSRFAPEGANATLSSAAIAMDKKTSTCIMGLVLCAVLYANISSTRADMRAHAAPPFAPVSGSARPAACI